MKRSVILCESPAGILFRAKPATHSGTNREVAGLERNARQVYAGTGGRFRAEQVAGLRRIFHQWKRHSICVGQGVHLRERSLADQFVTILQLLGAKSGHCQQKPANK